jgi:hypothetical protein
MPIPSVCRHSPLPASQILTVRSSDADASRVESCEKATELIVSLWPLSVCRHSPLPVSQGPAIVFLLVRYSYVRGFL